MAHRTELTGRSALWTGTRCSCVITELSEGNLLITLHGYNDCEIGPPVYDAMDAMIRRAGYVNVFMDTREQTGIAAAERERAISWGREQGERYRGHLLFRSRVLDMALALGNLVMRQKTRGYSDVGQFEAAIRAEVPWFGELPAFDLASASDGGLRRAPHRGP